MSWISKVHNGPMITASVTKWDRTSRLPSNGQCNWIPSPTAIFMGPTWGPSGADRAQVDPMLAPWTIAIWDTCSSEYEPSDLLVPHQQGWIQFYAMCMFTQICYIMRYMKFAGIAQTFSGAISWMPKIFWFAFRTCFSCKSKWQYVGVGLANGLTPLMSYMRHWVSLSQCWLTCIILGIASNCSNVIII